MIKVILLTLLVYWIIQTASYLILTEVFNKDIEEALVFTNNPIFHITLLFLYALGHKILPWFSENFCYSIVYCFNDKQVHYCKRKYQYALLNQENFSRCNFEVSDFCADKWKNDGQYYYDRYVPRYVKEMFPQVDKKICKQALETSNKDMENLKKRIKESTNNV